MLTKQKIILALLEKAQQPILRTSLVKYVFLLRNETALSFEPSLYDFVPYKYGPFSFDLYRDLEILQRDGLLILGEDFVSLNTSATCVRLNTPCISERIFRLISNIWNKYSSLSQNDLLSQVYQRYPWFAIKSERKDLLPNNLPKCPITQLAIYTVGYQGKSVDIFFNNLLKKGIQAICDVRANPVSRRYGFARKSLNDISEKLGIDYFHFPELGIPGNLRLNLSDYNSYQQLLDLYETQLLPRCYRHVLKLSVLMKDKPSVLVCMEKDVDCCHRSRLAKAVAETSALPIVHL